MGRKLGLFRAICLVSASCMGSFAFAFDTGVISGVLTLSSFQNDFGYTTAQKTSVNSNAVSILQAGAFFGCFFTTPIAKYLGRRLGLIVSSLVFTVGTILQVVNSHTLGTFYAGRVIAGLGIGAATVLIPVYAAEMSPKELRGRLGACFQLFFTLGVMIAYWVTYAVAKDQPSATKQWQIALGLQLLPSSLLLFGMLAVKESARWLASKGRIDQARESLKWVRGGEETEELQQEFDEILAGIAEEARIKEGFTLRELLLPANRYRLFIAFTIQLAAQLTGNTSLAYYATQIFSAVGAGNSSKLVTGFFGLVKVVGVCVFQLFVLDRVGRRWPFMVGAAAMGSFMLIIACVLATHPTNASATHASPAGIAMILMTYCEAFSYNMSWGPLPWLYVGEIFSSRMREIGVTVGAASQWLFNFMMSQITPHAIDNVGWRMFLMFAIFNYAVVVYAYVFLKETSQYSLEEMQHVFGGDRSPAAEKIVETGEAGRASGEATEETGGHTHVTTPKVE
ncbi:putative MFS sugar transporter [Aspergillus aculeatinus CBS 121060]|uniref:MFS sugar transporter n=1 Tax=Aspergillus aculeatinus CBS 121060 TaxID=1448322 RepID=A0ACD1H0T5_9EURO|nr:putative MFS sugar transporter [Aspergillus aculeatinus CBS 121060]RAH67226.1 putative MFS sugar transporter [Aspergillus aculeatinus CBS 121060]